MIPNVKDRALTSSGVSDGVQFGISLGNSAHLMTILRDTLYSDKILAVLREYGANAWDSHRTSGKRDLPIEVTIPTPLEPTLVIRDFGAGISHEDAFEVFTQYGASTKRNDDNSVGMLGIGSKSGFAYSDSFTVTSWHGGMKRVYTAVLDASDKGLFNLMHQEPCGGETGVMIQIAVKSEDIPDFEHTAKKLFRHFNPRPKINVELPELNKGRTVLQHGYIYNNSESVDGVTGWTAVMGCVPYRINLAQVRDVGEFLNKLSGVLYFDIGAVQINASREELKYSDDTKKALTAKFTDIVDEFVMKTLEDINNTMSTPWEKKLKAQVFRRLHLPVPDSVKGITEQYLKFGTPPPSFTLARKTTTTTHKRNRTSSTIGEETTSTISIRDETRILLRDDKNRALKGYALTDYDCFVRKHNPNASWVDVRKDLQTFLEKLGIDGVPVKSLSDMSWSRGNSSEKTLNPKHNPKMKVFRLTGSPIAYGRSLSKPWAPVEADWAPKPTDVFVILEGFHPSDMLSRYYSEDKKLFKIFGVSTPEIYGYKTTSKYPVTPRMIVGTSYSDWRDATLKSLAVGEYRKLLETRRWASSYFAVRSDIPKAVQSLVKELGPDHVLSSFVRKLIREKKAFRIIPKKKLEALALLEKRLDLEEDDDDVPKESEVVRHRTASTQKYPLIASLGIDVLWGKDGPHWVKYVKLIDNDTKQRESNVTANQVHADQRVADVHPQREQPYGPTGSPELAQSEGCAAE